MAFRTIHGRGLASCLSLLLVLAVSADDCLTDLSERHLLRDLLDVYGPAYVRPVLDEKTVTNVEYRLLINQLISLDTREESMRINGYLRVTWNDEFLQWEPSEYGNITEIYVAASRIWQPDITLLGNVDSHNFELTKDTMASVTPEGVVTWRTPIFLTGGCSVDVTYFPFDTQRCELTLSSWSYTLEHIDLTVATGPDSEQLYFAENGVWTFLGAETRREIKSYGSLVFPLITYTFTFQRISSFYSANLIVPFVSLTILAIMTFALPPDGGDAKIALLITTLVALFVFLQLVSGFMPPTGSAPYLASYFIIIIVLSCFYLLLVIVVYYLKCKSGSPSRRFRRIVLRYMAKAVFLYDKEIAGDADADDSDTKPEAEGKESETGAVGSEKTASDQDQPAGQRPLSIPSSLLNDVSFFRHNVEAKAAADVGRTQWFHASRVIDRWIFIITAILLVVLTVTLVVSSSG